MAYIKRNLSPIGRKVRLLEKKDSLAGFFEEGSIVTITDEDARRGFTFTDDEGNSVSEAGFTGFEYVDDQIRSR